LNLSWSTSCPYWVCSWFTSVSPWKFQVSNLIWSQLFLSESFPISHSPVICCRLTIKNRVFIEKLTFPLLLKKIPLFYGNWRFLAVFTKS
jgi:hypothetical protein